MQLIAFFFFRNIKSSLETFRLHDDFSSISGLMPNKEKCETAGGTLYNENY